MITNKFAVIAVMAIGILGFSSCDRNGYDSASRNAATTTDTTVSNSTTSTETGAAATTETAAGRTTATGTAVDTTSGGAGLAAEQPGTADSRETTVGAKKIHKKEMKKTHNKSGAAIPPRGDTNNDVAAANEEMNDESWSEDTSSSSATTSTETADSESDAVAEANRAHKAQAVDNSALSEKAKRDLAMMKQDEISKYYEPQSKSPDRTGSTSMTGQDRSHAELTQQPGPFADPTVIGKNDDVARLGPIQSLDLGKYSYRNRDQFKNLMETRLSLVQERIGTLRGKTGSQRPANYKDVLNNIENRHENAEQQLGRTNRVEAKNWESFKTNFRDQVSELENSVNSLQTSMVR